MGLAWRMTSLVRPSTEPPVVGNTEQPVPNTTGPVLASTEPPDPKRVATEVSGSTLGDSLPQAPIEASGCGPSRRARIGRATLFIGVFVVAAILGSIWSGPYRRAPATPAALHIHASALDFGEPWAQENFTWEVPIQNPSDQDIEIVGFTLPVCCKAHCDPPALVVPANATKTVKFSLDLTAPREHASKASFPFSLPFVAKLKDRGDHVSAELRGRVRNAISFTPTVADFEQSLQKGIAFSPRTVTVHRHFPLKDLRVECDQAIARVELQPSQGADAHTLFVHPRESLPDGPFEFFIAFSAASADGSPIPLPRLRVAGTIGANVRAFPPRIEFGLRNVGTVASQVVTLTSITEEPFKILAVECSCTSILAVPLHVPGTAAPKPPSREFSVAQTFSVPGSHQETIVFSIEGRERSRLVMPVHVHTLESSNEPPAPVNKD
jgi:hypothetical protein